MTRRGHRDDRGSAAVELPLVIGFFILVAVILVFAGRVNSGYASVEAAARYSARTISLSRDTTAAIDVARDEAEATVGLGSAKCTNMDFDHDVQPDHVTVTVTCTVDLADVDLFGMPGSWSVTATAEEPIDTWRETAP